jgi:hypothetical protein
MDVAISHHVEGSKADGYRYEYDLYRFSSGHIALVARSYSSEPNQAHFLRLEQHGKHRMLTDDDLRLPLFAESVAYLKSCGRHEVQWLSGRGNGYEAVKLET